MLRRRAMWRWSLSRVDYQRQDAQSISSEVRERGGSRLGENGALLARVFSERMGEGAIYELAAFWMRSGRSERAGADVQRRALCWRRDCDDECGMALAARRRERAMSFHRWLWRLAIFARWTTSR